MDVSQRLKLRKRNIPGKGHLSSLKMQPYGKNSMWGESLCRERQCGVKVPTPQVRDQKAIESYLSSRTIGQVNNHQIEIKSLDWVEERRIPTNTLKCYCLVFLITRLLGSRQKYNSFLLFWGRHQPSSRQKPPHLPEAATINTPLHGRWVAPPHSSGALRNESLFAHFCLCPRRCYCHMVSQKYTQRCFIPLDYLFWRVLGSKQQRIRDCWQGRRNDTEFFTKTGDLFHLQQGDNCSSNCN